MTLDTAKNIIDWIFANVPENMNGVEIGFIGGEPLLEFELIREIVEYTCSQESGHVYIFYATTNGTILTNEMKSWFTTHKECFVLGLSIDGDRDTHNFNRSNSFDSIDIDFFLKTWPEQGIKMTLSEYSLPRLAQSVKYLHSLGFKDIGGVNLSEGEFDWSKDEYISLLIPQLQELVEFYVENDELVLNQMLNKPIHICEAKARDTSNWCGIGTGAIFFDVDGTRYPCPFVTPMTFTQSELHEIAKIDFTDNNKFLDVECFNKCYIYPICPTCVGANLLTNKTFRVRDRRRCKAQKLFSLFAADLHARRILKNPDIYGDDTTLYHTIEAIKAIRTQFMPEFDYFLSALAMQR